MDELERCLRSKNSIICSEVVVGFGERYYREGQFSG